MDTKEVLTDRRSFIKTAGSAGIATILVADGSSNYAQASENHKPKDDNTYSYATQTSWGNITEWHDAPDIGFSFDLGTNSIPANLAGRDQQGNSFAVGFSSDMNTFFGYFQRYNEGPIAYRGTRK
ncbi:hypothetical protein [Dictyobacter kobayashii]|uniref:OAA-family lectin sugar binding domain-containing protein n=1 Tax=Dictyobacter kobayashii TaxID=2014872 RepID=A0A402AYL4_9CHLR|nr:hypothetical protein [Dictyobacter kobayashii]GCE24202.1 hypothetical protein KDK_80020 [Dictyobacter kobayashii]